MHDFKASCVSAQHTTLSVKTFAALLRPVLPKIYGSSPCCGCNIEDGGFLCMSHLGDLFHVAAFLHYGKSGEFLLCIRVPLGVEELQE
jgi:hypothetical protein